MIIRYIFPRSLETRVDMSAHCRCGSPVRVSEDTLVLSEVYELAGVFICNPCAINRYPAEYSAFIARKLMT